MLKLNMIQTALGQQTLESDPALTITQEAARLDGESRPFMAKLIASGAIEHYQIVGNQWSVQ